MRAEIGYVVQQEDRTERRTTLAPRKRDQARDRRVHHVNWKKISMSSL